MKSIILQIALIALLPRVGSGETLRTSYLELDLPSGWKCEQIETSWACRPTTPKELNRATLILTAKQASPADHPAALRQSLLKKKPITVSKGVTLTPKLQWERSISSNGTEWAEALYLNSEIKDFYSYYLTASKNQYTVLLNLNFEKGLSTPYQSLLASLRPSLRFLNNRPQADAQHEEGPKGPIVTTPPPEAQPHPPLDQKPQGISRFPLSWWILGAGLALVLAWALTRR